MHADHVPHKVRSDRHGYSAIHGDLLHHTRGALHVVKRVAIRRPRDPQALGNDLVQFASVRSDKPDTENESIVSLARHKRNPPSVWRPDRDADSNGGIVFEGDLPWRPRR